MVNFHFILSLKNFRLRCTEGFRCPPQTTSVTLWIVALGMGRDDCRSSAMLLLYCCASWCSIYILCWLLQGFPGKARDFSDLTGLRAICLDGRDTERERQLQADFPQLSLYWWWGGQMPGLEQVPDFWMAEERGDDSCFTYSWDI